MAYESSARLITKMRFETYLLSAILAGSAIMATAGESELLSLEKVISDALANNFSYQIAELDPQIAQQSLTGQEAAFDTEIFASGNIAQSEQATTFTQVEGTSSDNRNWRAGARKRLVYGTTVTAQSTLNRRDSDAGVNNFPLSQSADISISIRQPLMNGFGREANTASIEGARAGLRASIASYKRTVQDIIAQVELAYWQVSRWQEQLELNRSNLVVSETLLEEARERERVGMVTQIEVLQAQAFNAESKEDIIATTRSLGDAYDRLLTLMGTLPQTEFSVAPENSVERLYESDDPVPDFSAAWELAVETDPALTAQAEVIEQRKLELMSAEDATRPNLDLVVAGAYSGIDDQTATEAFQNTFDRDGKAWSIGVEFSMPWSRRRERADFRIADLRMQKEVLRYDDFKQSLYQDVRSSWRALQAVQQSVDAAKLTVNLQQAYFEREKEKYESGLSAFRDVLEAQRDLDQAQVRLLLSKYNKISAEINLASLTGTIFQRHGISPDLPTSN